MNDSLLRGNALLESLDVSLPVENFQQKEIEDVINKLEETASILRHQLSAPTPGKQEKAKQRKTLHKWMNKLAHYILYVTFMWQIITVVVLMSVFHLDPGEEKRNNKVLFGYYTLVVLQIINILGVLVAAGRLTHQLAARDTISGWFVGHCYIATVLSFTGLYMVTYRLRSSSWVVGDIQDSNDIGFIMDLFLRFLHLSASTASLCGISTISPDAWYNFLASTIQMLLSFIYFASILGKMIGVASSRAAKTTDMSSTTSTGGTSLRGADTLLSINTC